MEVPGLGVLPMDTDGDEAVPQSPALLGDPHCPSPSWKLESSSRVSSALEHSPDTHGELEGRKKAFPELLEVEKPRLAPLSKR